MTHHSRGHPGNLLLKFPTLYDNKYVTVINNSSSDDENYDGLLECARQLAGETSDKSSMEGGMQPGVKPGVSNMPIPKMSQ